MEGKWGLGTQCTDKSQLYGKKKSTNQHLKSVSNNICDNLRQQNVFGHSIYSMQELKHQRANSDSMGILSQDMSASSNTATAGQSFNWGISSLPQEKNTLSYHFKKGTARETKYEHLLWFFQHR